MKRRLIQLYTALLYNLNPKGFAEASIYKGKSKGLCVLGLNCYSCPGAVGSCPLGTLQDALSAMDRKLPFHILEVLLLFGVTMGRTICGFICPFGLVQELLYKIPVSKIRKNCVIRKLFRVKYVILAVFITIPPVVFRTASGLPVPAFCRYICPAGTLEGGIPLVLLDGSLGGLAGAFFNWKVLVMAVVLVSACFVYRSLCRFLYPLDAIYSLSAPATLLGVNIDKDACIDCGCCVRACKMDIGQMGDRECTQCGECTKECNVDAIYWKRSWNVNGKVWQA